MTIYSVLAAAPDVLRAVSIYDPDHSYLGLLLGCLGGWWIATAMNRLTLARKKAEAKRRERPPSSERRPD